MGVWYVTADRSRQYRNKPMFRTRHLHVNSWNVMGFLCACLAGAAVLHMGTNISWELVGSTKGNKTDYSNTALKLSACLFPVRNVDACKCMH